MSQLQSLFHSLTGPLVIKVGSCLLADMETGTLKADWLQALCHDIHSLHSRGIDCIIVSSGSIALGRGALGLNRRPNRLEEAQAAAAIGQIKLAEAYAKAFNSYGLTAAQMLLTLDDLENRPKYLNARATLETLLAQRIIPIINENDTVATSEIRFGDNDRLAARVGALAGAGLVLLLSDIDGLYSANPHSDPAASFIPYVAAITPEIEAMAGPAEEVNNAVGTGGMVTKLMAAKMATKAGCPLAIALGTGLHPVQQVMEQGRGTLFPAAESPLSVRKKWINGLQAPKGFLHLDAGAEKALRGGSSLLPVGVTQIDGSFDRGDLVALLGSSGKLIGQGFVNFTSTDADRIKACSADRIIAMIGKAARSTMIHRDDLVLF